MDIYQLKREYQESVRKFEELEKEFGNEAHEKHQEWLQENLKQKKHKEENEHFLKALTPKEREQFTLAFGELEV